MKKQKIKKILIANRGEIAIRVIRACKDMGIATVAVFSDPDRAALHVRRADEAYRIGPASPAESYLNWKKIIETAQIAGADAIHPGYGFLSENTAFAREVEKSGLIFIGPDPDVIHNMGSKIESRKIAEKAKIPLIPGIQHPLKDASEAKGIAKKLGYPVLLKAASGGGGKGMRTVDQEADLESAFHMAQNEAKASFNDDAIYVEKLIQEPHHIEVQVFGDRHGNVVHLFERECSVQRRHQKVIEESPSPFITEETRKKVCEMAVQLAKSVGYYNAGTVECLVDKDQNYYFLEMNTRLQVEHPITEMVTGTDLVKAQILVAQGEPLPFKQGDLSQRGHAVECRIYAEDPFHQFRPAPGKIIEMQYPTGPGVRLDNGIYTGYTIPLEYDPILSKLITYGATRTEAIERMQRALSEYRISGPKTNLYFHQRALAIPDFIRGKYDTRFVEQHLENILEVPQTEKTKHLMAAALAKFLRDKKTTPANRPGGGSAASPWKMLGRERNLT